MLRKKTYLLLYENLIVPNFNKLEFPLSKDALCKVWLKLAQQIWRRRFFQFRQCIFNVFSLFRYYLR